MPGACNTDGVVYQANVKNNVGGQESYIGLAQNFKERFRKHRKNLTNNNFEEKITLYTHFWKEQERQTSHRGAYCKKLTKIDILDRTGEDF